MSDEKKMGVQETSELLAFLTRVINDLDQAKDDDGKIDSMEWARIALTNAPSSLSALRGIDKIDDEVKDLDNDEAKVLAEMGLKLAMAVMDLLGVHEREDA